MSGLRFDVYVALNVGLGQQNGDAEPDCHGLPELTQCSPLVIVITGGTYLSLAPTGTSAPLKSFTT